LGRQRWGFPLGRLAGGGAERLGEGRIGLCGGLDQRLEFRRRRAGRGRLLFEQAQVGLQAAPRDVAGRRLGDAVAPGQLQVERADPGPVPETP